MSLIVVPDVIGLGRLDAEAALDRASLRHIAQFPFDAGGQGLATQQDPPGGALTEPFSVVTVAYPSVVGGGIPDSPVEGPSPPPVKQFQQIALKFASTLDVPYQDNLEQVLGSVFGPLWDDFVARLPFDLTIMRMYATLDPDSIRALQDTAKAASGTDFDLLHWFRVPFPENADADALAAQLRALPFVEQVFVETQPELAMARSTEPQRNNQWWQDDAPIGVGADHARDVPGGLGEGVHLGDVEYGWELEHEDLNGMHLVELLGQNRIIVPTPQGPYNARGHGTPVLGIIAAGENGVGGVGLAPEVNLHLFSPFRDSPPGDGFFDLHGTILQAIERLARHGGSILLLEQQDASKGPLEINPLLQWDIFLATAVGVTVIEPAGNGRQNLDEFRIEGKQVLNANTTDFFDSGAVMVGAVTSVLPHLTSEFSSFGTRVDCSAWGDSIYAAALGDYDFFNGTSGASAIVAGIAASVQGMMNDQRGRFLSPAELRDLLSSRLINDPDIQVLGPPMPNLGAIAAALPH